MLKSFFKILGIFFIGIFGGIFGSQILWPYFVERPLFLKYRLEQTPIYEFVTKEVKIQENAALQDAVGKVEKTVVGVKTTTKKGKIFEGSGFILTSDGLIITLADLVPEGSPTIFINGEEVDSQVLKKGAKDNLALLKIEERNLSTVGFGSMEKMKLGQRVFLVGVIFTKEVIQKKVNEGIVKYFDQNALETNIKEDDILEGSTLFDIEGNIIGLNLIDEEGEIISIPISTIKSFTGL